MRELFKKGFESWAVALIFALIISISLVVLFGHFSYDFDGFRLGFRVVPSQHGETEFSIPPFGEITASTHKTPVKIKIVFERIYLHEISKIANEIDGSEELVKKIEPKGKESLNRFVVRLIVLAAIGGAVGGALSPRRRHYKALAGMIVGALSLGVLVAGTYQTYNVDAFKQPRYSGALSVAPWATEEIAKRLADIKAFRAEVRDITKNINHFYSKIDSWQPIEEDTIKVLHVSDIHNNPAAVDLIKRVVADFNVDMVVDTGDITDFGTPLEAPLFEGIASLPVPYVFIAGNHDSSETVSFMRQMKNVIILEGRPVSVEGITILGVPDPASMETSVSPSNDTTIDMMRVGIKRKIDSMAEKPLILAVHDPRAAKGFFGKVPIVLVGHTHRAGLEEKDGYILNNAGTTGAAGIRTFRVQKGVPYTLNLLHIERSTKSLVAVDSLAVIGAEREFRLERNLIEGKMSLEAELETSNMRE